MMTASMPRRRTKIRIKTLTADFSYQLYFIENLYLPTDEHICQIAFLKHISPT